MKIASISIAIILVLALALPGGAFLISPLRSRQTAEWVRVASFAELEFDGAPQMFAIHVPRSDGWTRMPDQCIGRVFLRRIPGTEKVAALHTHHSRYGTAVTYYPAERIFKCQCFGVEFNLDGQLRHPERDAGFTSGMQTIEAKVVSNDVFVRWSETRN
jgi:hypothetical protein